MSEQHDREDQAGDDATVIEVTGDVGKPREPSRRWPMTGPPSGA